MLTLGEHGRADRLRSTLNHATLLVLQTRRQQQVQLFQVPHLRDGHEMIPPELPSFPFHAAFLMPFPRRAKLRLEPPVRTESDESRCLFPLMPTQYFLYRDLQVVVTQHAENPAKI